MRHKRACLITDLNQITADIEKHLHMLHALYALMPQQEEEVKVEKSKEVSVEPRRKLEDGVWISDVQSGSPAATAGFAVGD